jgi:hypothetical protein
MKIYTAHYRYSGDDRLDITVKGNTYPGNVLAPTWEMVKDYKAGKIDQWLYATQYFGHVVSRVSNLGMDGRVMRAALNNITERQQVTLVCFCPAGDFCHRIIAARMLETICDATYVGEWQI